MSKKPVMPFYIDAYLADTTHLSTEEDGAYLLLLFAMWRRGGQVPDNDIDNARITKLTLERWKEVKARLTPFLAFYGPVNKREISQSKLVRVWNASSAFSQAQSERGKRSAKNRAERKQTLSSKSGSHSVATETQPRTVGVRYQPEFNHLNLNKKDISSSLPLTAREEETTTLTQPPPDGAWATDGPAPPALQEKPSSHYLLETPFMRRAAAKGSP